MAATDETLKPSGSCSSLPPWPTVRFRRMAPGLVLTTLAVYSIASVVALLNGGGLDTVLTVAFVGFLITSSVLMLAGFTLRAFDSWRIRGTCFVGVGALLGALAYANHIVLTWS